MYLGQQCSCSAWLWSFDFNTPVSTQMSAHEMQSAVTLVIITFMYIFEQNLISYGTVHFHLQVL